MTKKQPKKWEKLREILVEFGSTSPVRNWDLENITFRKMDGGREFKRIQEENFKHIDYFTDILFEQITQAEKRGYDLKTKYTIEDLSKAAKLKEEQIRQKAKLEVVEEVEKLPKYDLSKNGISGDYYLKREEVLKSLKSKYKKQ